MTAGRQIAAGILVGPTATGKSAVAQWIAEHTGAPVLSADSMLVYSGMDIGTAKPTAEERGDVPYFGIDCVDAGAPFSTGAWLAFVRRQLACHFAPPNHPAITPPHLIVAGGTGLYVKALLEGLDAPPSDPDARAKWTALYREGGLPALQAELAQNPDAMALLPPGDALNPRRIIRALERTVACPTTIPPHHHSTQLPHHPTTAPVAGLAVPRDRLAAQIMDRIHRMFANGLVDEAVALRSSGGLSETAAAAIGYAEALAVADGLMTVAEAKERVATRTRQLAKRQMTWFRHQLKVEWIDVGEDDSPATLGPKVMEIWKRNGLREISI